MSTAAKVLGPQSGKLGMLGSIGVRFMVSGTETGGGFSLVEHPMPPRKLAAPLHRHSREDEYSFVLEGRVGALLGDEVVYGDASERTRAALQAAKARGRKLGNPRLAEAQAAGAATGKEQARQFAANVLPVVREIQAAGATSANAIAAKLNERRVPTARGGKWTHVQVAQVLSRSA